MRFAPVWLFAWIVAGIIAIIVVIANADWIDTLGGDALGNDRITESRPPGDTGERLVATLSKSADGGPPTLHCTYHATLSFAP